ncbi:efflux RND transporter periplasmic adaptor subunit [Sunxiuqinia sp. sy24]|uniref:efflux RND transporter periplasmic adaptor subunit n=1 Tax=Sunxiuqinia sp. sy24 TaxID=3461495 RepID=UPI004045DE98
MKKNKKLLIRGIPVLVVLVVALFFLLEETVVSGGKNYVVKNGSLDAVIESVGEVKGEKATEINIPMEMRDRDLRIWQVKIVDMVEEGKIVKKGDYIAQLDQTEISNRMRDRMQEKEKRDADLKNARIDSTVRLTQLREGITNSKLDLEYNKIDLEQSKYESEAYQRKTQMAYQKAEIQVEKKRRDYLLEQNRLKMQVQRHEKRLDWLNDLIDRYQKAIAATRVTTPEDGIVMFGTNWSGRKYSKDDEISTYRPLLATLPDMSTVISETYVKEIDISKISKGDSVNITIDALPNKSYTGEVVYIASIGEDHQGFDMKVFKVIVRFNESDDELKPGMTCSNHIVFEHYNDRPIIPLEAVYTDSLQRIVFLKHGGKITKQPVELGAENKGMTVVLEGLQEGDRILMHPPEDML